MRFPPTSRRCWLATHEAALATFRGPTPATLIDDAIEQRFVPTGPVMPGGAG